MKILTGTLRGRQIRFRANPYLRPTADKVRKALFDTLSGAIEGAKVLDLFSGTGALGLEALSGGAAEAVFVEADVRQAANINENLKALGLEKKAKVLCIDAIKAIEALHRQGEIFDLVFLDPPYSGGWEARSAKAVSKHPILSKNAWTVIESSFRDVAALATFGSLVKIKEKIYGDTRVVFYGASGAEKMV